MTNVEILTPTLKMEAESFCPYCRTTNSGIVCLDRESHAWFESVCFFEGLPPPITETEILENPAVDSEIK